ncbi:YciI family protein (plasmid) [Agrobacterium leguminum]|uniref:YCII-related domain-containing protein n=1 Tax=Agrobacterium deltaense NCPPB 1641 TaxID=1183425 RepID=A0A1S7UAZ1_9HYPH|nr:MULTISPECIES: YciI family protein [Agrobacterium]WFS69744.1 YciI family protein [Agrobacterium leguminum]CVI64054.1 conserved hypothetical protein [Agrobacterium deltaense NCPPB 1641]
MHYVVHCIDHSDGLSRRLENYEAHKAHLATGAVKTVVSGPLVADDGETMIGSMFIFEANSKDEVIAFNANDPFRRANVWAEVRIHPFLKRVDNRA